MKPGIILIRIVLLYILSPAYIYDTRLILKRVAYFIINLLFMKHDID